MKTIKTNRTNTTKTGSLRDLALDAVGNFAKGAFDVTHSYYWVEDMFLDQTELDQISQVPDTKIYNFEVAPGGDVPEHFFAVSDLSADMPTSFPNSTTTDEEGNVEAVTWQMVQDSESVNIPQNDDGNYYFPVTANDGFRPLTLDEFDAITEPIILAKDVPANAPEDGEV